jgi:ubiquitin carboxyl-terminal hydrolase 5/13
MDVINDVVQRDPSCCKKATALDYVLNSECCYTFFNPHHEPGGILVSLSTFIGTTQELAVNPITTSSTTCSMYVRIRSKRLLKELEDNKEQPPTRLAIGLEGGFQSEAEKYTTTSEYSVVVLDGIGSVLAELPYTTENKKDFPEAVSSSVDSIINHTGTITQHQIDETWQDEPIPVSKFAESLPYVDNDIKINPDPSSWKCEKTGATENLWLNLSDGFVGGGRKHWDGSGGSNGALDHYNETGQQYPLVVKLGTITADVNTADCYSYDPTEDGPVKVPNLAQLLQKRGISICSMEKTVKSTAELEVELNANYAFDAITESGSELQPVTGPFLQGE